jgi:hypothetical protein
MPRPVRIFHLIHVDLLRLRGLGRRPKTPGHVKVDYALNTGAVGANVMLRAGTDHDGEPAEHVREGECVHGEVLTNGNSE